MKAVFFIAVAQASQPSYEDWVAKYGIVTNDAATKDKYYLNVALIDDLNANPNQSATFAVNQFSGMTFDEFASVYLTAKEEDAWRLAEAIDTMDLKKSCCWSNWGDESTCKGFPIGSGGGKCNTDWSHSCNGDMDCPDHPPPPPPPPTPPSPSPPAPPAPPAPPHQCDANACDWDVTPVKDQGGCGSCWAFSTTAAIEHVHKINTGETVSLAEQQLVDCTSGSCAGGLPSSAMDELKSKDIYSTSSYPYTGGDGNCLAQGLPSGVKISGYTNVPKSDDGLAAALRSSSASVTLYADSKFQHYSSGVVTGVSTSCHINHAVLATGYGSNFWKIKNSWGTGWGEHGFIRFERTTAGCGPFGLFYLNPIVPTELRAAESIQV